MSDSHENTDRTPQERPQTTPKVSIDTPHLLQMMMESQQTMARIETKMDRVERDIDKLSDTVESTSKQVSRAQNAALGGGAVLMVAMGLVYWLFGSDVSDLTSVIREYLSRTQ